MQDAEELFKKWKQYCPPKVRIEDFRKVAYHYLKPWLKEKTRGSHFLILQHPSLQYHSAFEAHDTFAVAIKGGSGIKRIYVEHLIKAIEWIREWEAQEEGNP